MADQKISDLSAVTTPTGADLVELVQSGSNLKMTLAQLLAMGTSPGTFSTLNSGELNMTGPIEPTLSASGDTVLDVRVSGDGNPRLKVTAAGTMVWGSGSGAGDVTAERLSAGVLKLTSSQEVHGGFTVDRIGDAADALARIAGDAGEYRALVFRTGTTDRWRYGADTTAEGGSDAGSDLVLTAYDDAGSAIGDALKITRASMDAVFGAKLKATGDLTVGSDKLVVTAASGNLVSAGSLAATLGAWFRTTALGLTDTTGHFYIPTCSGVPTGIPATKTGQVALQYDSTNDDLYVYSGDWKKVAMA
jgi:hypothetical protein